METVAMYQGKASDIPAYRAGERNKANRTKKQEEKKRKD